MANQHVVADAGPLIAFGKMKELSLLKKTLGKILVPQPVLDECLLNMSLPGAQEISEAINKKIILLHGTVDIHSKEHFFDILGLGEASAIALALKLKAGLLMDEKLGRQTAQKMNLHVIGTGGVLLLAKRKKLIKKVTPLIQELKNSGYYLSKQLIKNILIRANEIE